jgi:hypothetical protein
MANGKRTVWVPLDHDLAAALRARTDAPISAQVNEAVRHELSRRSPDSTPAWRPDNASRPSAS